MRTYDPGYVNTAACISRISYIDGGRGILRYRGYPIEQLAEQSNFLETAYLLMYGNLPDKRQLGVWRNAVMQHVALPKPVANVIAALPASAHPMGALVAGIAALGVCHPEQNPAVMGGGVYKAREVQDKQITRLLGAVPAIAAHAFHRMEGDREVPEPQPFQPYTAAFLQMIGHGREPHPVLAKALDIMFVLHAEHEMNCSTAACRHLASSGVDVYTAVAGAVGALYGPLHGGANEAVLRMLERIGSPDSIPAFLERVKSKEEKLYGFGHRVYKNFDPRAKIIRRVAEDVFAVTERNPLIDTALKLMEAARTDRYFIDRNLYPNVDFFSGLVYRAMGFPPQFFTVLFAIPRVAGYLSHWREQLADPDTKIMRPQQDYRGIMYRDYVDIDGRQSAKTGI